MKRNTNTVFYGLREKTGALPDTGHENGYVKVGEMQTHIWSEPKMMTCFPGLFCVAT